MYKNILILRTSAPLENTSDCNELDLLAKLFKSEKPPVARNNKVFYLYDVDTTLLLKCDAIFQQFRLRVEKLDPHERGRQVPYITFEKFYFEARRI